MPNKPNKSLSKHTHMLPLHELALPVRRLANKSFKTPITTSRTRTGGVQRYTFTVHFNITLQSMLDNKNSIWDYHNISIFYSLSLVSILRLWWVSCNFASVTEQEPRLFAKPVENDMPNISEHLPPQKINTARSQLNIT